MQSFFAFPESFKILNQLAPQVSICDFLLFELYPIKWTV